MIMFKRFIAQKQINLIRGYASGPKLVEINQDEKTGITTLSMGRAPVNSLNLELLDELKTCLTDAQKNKSRGIILTSSMPTVFSAGLDIMEMYKPDLKRAESFWHTLQDTWMTLYGLDLPVAAAINGASPAGGCLLAISCEYRVFVNGKHTIGLNETQLGISAPKWFQDPYIATIGYRKAELALLKGSQFTPEEALQIGLVDELAVDKDDAVKKCLNYISFFNKISYQARAVTKSDMRKPVLSWLKQNKESDTTKFLSFLQMPSVQTGLDLYIKSLKKK